MKKYCPACGRKTSHEIDYCPYCAQLLIDDPDDDSQVEDKKQEETFVFSFSSAIIVFFLAAETFLKILLALLEGFGNFATLAVLVILAFLLLLATTSQKWLKMPPKAKKAVWILSLVTVLIYSFAPGILYFFKHI